MRVGVFLLAARFPGQSDGEVLAAAVDAAVAAERAGFDDVLLDALTRESVSAAGPAFTFREVAVVPRPRTCPHPPVVVAATSAATARLAAARGLPMLLGMHIGDEARRELIAGYQAAAARRGRPAGGHIATMLAYVADTRAQAQRVLRRELPRWLGPGLAGYVPVDGRLAPARNPDDYAEMLCGINPVGTAADCVEIMAATVERTGIGHLIVMAEGAGDPVRTRENIARLGAEVLPALRERVSSRPVPGAG